MRRRRRNKKKMKGGDLVGGINGRPSYSRSITQRLMRDPDDMRGYYRSGNNYHARRTWTQIPTSRGEGMQALLKVARVACRNSFEVIVLSA